VTGLGAGLLLVLLVVDLIEMGFNTGLGIGAVLRLQWAIEAGKPRPQLETLHRPSQFNPHNRNSRVLCL